MKRLNKLTHIIIFIIIIIFFWLPGIQITTFYEIKTKHAINNIFIASHILREQLFFTLVAITGFRETDNMIHIMINCSCRHNNVNIILLKIDA